MSHATLDELADPDPDVITLITVERAPRRLAAARDVDTWIAALHRRAADALARRLASR